MARKVLAPGECQAARGKLRAAKPLRLLLGPLPATWSGCTRGARSTTAHGNVVHRHIVLRVAALRWGSGTVGGIASTSRCGRQSSLSRDVEVVVVWGRATAGGWSVSSLGHRSLEMIVLGHAESER